MTAPDVSASIRDARERRARALAELSSRQFDLLIVGGGIIGAGIAEAATATGMRVALVDRADFGGATSSASSKLIHGGLRYLALGDVRLVREAHRERRTLLCAVAPHLVQRMSFLFPFYADGPYSRSVVSAGIFSYSLLARSRVHPPVGPRRARELIPALRTSGLKSASLYADASTNDSRLALLNLRAAADAGAIVANYAAVVEIRDDGAVVRSDNETFTVRARRVVNATGPWVDELRRLEAPHARRSIRLSKGVHVLVDGGDGWNAAVTIPQPGGRVTFAIPWYGVLLLGTTDEPFEAAPNTVAATAADVAQVLAEARQAVEEIGSPIGTFAGLRALPIGTGDTTRARRETVLTLGPRGMLSVAGGKLTTYRQIAIAALRHLGVRPDTRPRPLPGATGAVAWPDDVPPSARQHLWSLYGSLADDVLAKSRDVPDALERIVPDRPDVCAQLTYAFEEEWALSHEDAVRRRTTAWITRGNAGENATRGADAAGRAAR